MSGILHCAERRFWGDKCFSDQRTGEPQPVRLDEDQLERLNRLERRLDAVIVAYQRGSPLKF